MLILLPLLRRLSIRSRLIIGVIVTAAGSALTGAAATFAPGLMIHGIVTAVVGVIFLGSVWIDGRRRRALVA